MQEQAEQAEQGEQGEPHTDRLEPQTGAADVEEVIGLGRERAREVAGPGAPELDRQRVDGDQQADGDVDNRDVGPPLQRAYQEALGEGPSSRAEHDRTGDGEGHRPWQTGEHADEASASQRGSRRGQEQEADVGAERRELALREVQQASGSVDRDECDRQGRIDCAVEHGIEDALQQQFQGWSSDR